jgi:hypothetical protein
MAPNLRTVCTQPARVTVVPMCAARSSPQVWDRNIWEFEKVYDKTEIRAQIYGASGVVPE